MDRAGQAGCMLGLWLVATPLLAQRLAPVPAQQSVTPAPLQASSPQARVPAPPAPDPLLASHDLQVGTFYYNRGDYVGALSRYQDAIVHDPASAEARCRAGDTERKLHNTAAAQQDWRRCLRLAADAPASHDSTHWAEHARKALTRQQ